MKLVSEKFLVLVGRRFQIFLVGVGGSRRSSTSPTKYCPSRSCPVVNLRRPGFTSHNTIQIFIVVMVLSNFFSSASAAAVREEASHAPPPNTSNMRTATTTSLGRAAARSSRAGRAAMLLVTFASAGVTTMMLTNSIYHRSLQSEEERSLRARVKHLEAELQAARNHRRHW